MGKTPGQLGSWLAEELRKRGYNLQRGGQSRFARESGLNVSSINRVLNEGRSLEIEGLRRIAEALGYSLGEVMIFAGVADPDELPIRAGTTAPDPAQAAETPPPRYDDPILQHLWDTPDENLSDEQRGMLIQLYLAVKRASDQPQSGGASAARMNRRAV
ncbi:helix-turn-helix domain-containing protein [Planomonospora corallina]|uniref:Helix-turn-helix domain-containing protein n=1 Tax=Planomonospora corallina TaxID=1806052 RepID=A0ABV8II58_9ACTN